MKSLIILFFSALFLSSCMVIKHGEVGVRRKMGKIDPRPMEQGPRFYNPISSTVFIVPTKLINREVTVPLPSREGLTIQSEISLLYRVNPRQAPQLFNDIGLNYESILVMPVFRSAAADVSARYFAKDMHSGERASIEEGIKESMMKVLGPKGLIVENVLLKSIILPEDLGRAIEEKLRAEQEAQRMEFVKQRESIEAERLLIAAEGEQKAKIARAEGSKKVAELVAEGDANAILIRAEAQTQANRLLSASLSPQILNNNQIEAFRELSKSENSKVIITDGKTPFLSLPGLP